MTTSGRHAPEQPPPGRDTEPPRTRPTWLAWLKREQPEVYAARHVARAVGEVTFAALGIGAILRSLLPRIEWGWLPDITWTWLPDIDLPRIPDPLGWLASRLWALLPDIGVPAWALTVLRSTRWWMPVLIAVLVAVREVDKRRAATDDDHADRHAEQSGNADGHPDHDEQSTADDVADAGGPSPGASGTR